MSGVSNPFLALPTNRAAKPGVHRSGYGPVCQAYRLTSQTKRFVKLAEESLQEVGNWLTLDGLDPALDHVDDLRLIEQAAGSGVPVIASLNGSTTGGWTEYACAMQDVGAAAIGLDIYYLPSDPLIRPQDAEQRYIDILTSVKAVVSVSVAVKPLLQLLRHAALLLDGPAAWMEHKGFGGAGEFRGMLSPAAMSPSRASGGPATLAPSSKPPGPAPPGSLKCPGRRLAFLGEGVEALEIVAAVAGLPTLALNAFVHNRPTAPRSSLLVDSQRVSLTRPTGDRNPVSRRSVPQALACGDLRPYRASTDQSTF